MIVESIQFCGLEREPSEFWFPEKCKEYYSNYALYYIMYYIKLQFSKKKKTEEKWGRGNEMFNKKKEKGEEGKNQ